MDERIEKARAYIDQNYTRDLSVRDRTVLAVATEAGFATLSNFNRAFVSLTGCAPNRYRSEERKKEEEARRKGEEASPEIPHNYPVSSFIRRIIEMNLKEATLPDMDVAYLTRKGSYLETGPLWKRLMEWAMKHDVMPPAHRFFGISYDEPCMPDDAKTSDVCVILPPLFDRSEGAVLYKTVPGGLFLKYVFYDANERFGLVYKDVVTDYLPTSVYGLDTDRNFLEFVMNDPFTDPEGKVRIDLYIPVGPRKS